MEGNPNNSLDFDSRPVFRKQPILCPWISSQPYPSAQLLENKLNDLAKKHGTNTNNSTSTVSNNLFNLGGFN